MTVHSLLVVEDNSYSRNPLRSIFHRMGWDVSVAGSVAEGIQFLDTHPEPCCLVLDLGLPDGQGEDVLRQVRERGLKTRVVVATGVVDGKRLRSVSELGLDALLTKPISLGEVWNGDEGCRVCGRKAT